MTLQIYNADWVLPVTAPPIHRGAVVIDGEQIIFVGLQDELTPAFVSSPTETHDFGRAAILPGLVNTHAHLELTLMRGFLEDLPFREWILKLTQTRRERLLPEDLDVASTLGAAEAIRAGITTIADTGASPAPFDALRRSGLCGIAYREVFGPDTRDAVANLEVLKANVAQMREQETDLVKVGVSPHAPYTVSAELFRRTIAYAAQEALDVAIHTAESAAEEQLLRKGEGDFADLMRARGIEIPVPGVSTIRYFNALGVLDAAPLLIHCVRVDDEEINMIHQKRARVAHCPKSNAKFGHGVAPFANMLAAGIQVGLGTDSVASNNRLDLLDEARFCALTHRATSQNFREPSARSLLQMMTLDGARVLGLADKVGSLESGKRADLIAIDLSGGHNQPLHDVEAAILFSAASSDILFTMVAGRPLFTGGQIQSFDEAEILSRADTARNRMV